MLGANGKNVLTHGSVSRNRSLGESHLYSSSPGSRSLTGGVARAKAKNGSLVVDQELLDVLVLLVTWSKTAMAYRETRRLGIKAPLVTLLFRDGK